MPARLPNIDYSKSGSNFIVDSEYSEYYLPYYKDDDYFFTLDNFDRFIKGCEREVRKSKYYKRYIKYLKQVGFNFCQVLPNVVDNDIEDEEDVPEVKKTRSTGKVDIEMHHGPILTLYDYCAIITEAMLARKEKISSFIVADRIMTEHFDNTIQVVMLSKTMHEAVHDGDIFISINQAIGDLPRFIKKYKDGIGNYIEPIKQYIRLSEEHGSFDKNVLNIQQAVKKWEDKYGF